MVSKSEVAKIASLARLDFTEQQLDSFLPRFCSILDMVHSLQNLSCEDVEPTLSVHKQNIFLRNDELDVPAGNDEVDAIFLNAPMQNIAKSVRHFVVPKVIE